MNYINLILEIDKNQGHEISLITIYIAVKPNPIPTEGSQRLNEVQKISGKTKKDLSLYLNPFFYLVKTKLFSFERLASSL